MKALSRTLFCCLLLLLFVSHNSQSQEPERAKAQDLISEISIPSQVHVVDGRIEGQLILKNVTDRPLRICTLVSGSRHIWSGNYSQTFSPDWWNSNRPKPEKFFAGIVVLYPNDTFTLPIKIPYEYNAEFFRGLPLTVSAGYSVGKDFAKQYDTWEGSTNAEPVTVTVLE